MSIPPPVVNDMSLIHVWIQDSNLIPGKMPRIQIWSSRALRLLDYYSTPWIIPCIPSTMNPVSVLCFGPCVLAPTASGHCSSLLQWDFKSLRTIHFPPLRPRVAAPHDKDFTKGGSGPGQTVCLLSLNDKHGSNLFTAEARYRVL